MRPSRLELMNSQKGILSKINIDMNMTGKNVLFSLLYYNEQRIKELEDALCGKRILEDSG
jgi:hypothetical protein